MNGPFRIYYECYEQAAHYLLPALLQIEPNANFELVRLSLPSFIATKNIP